MIWLVWDSDGETVADAHRIDEHDCISAAEEWARRDGWSDAANIDSHLKFGLRLCVAASETSTPFVVKVYAEASVTYTGVDVPPDLAVVTAECHDGDGGAP